MLSVEDWAEIRRLRRSEGLPVKAIARVLGISRNTVRAALASDANAAASAGGKNQMRQRSGNAAHTSANAVSANQVANDASGKSQ